MNEEKDFMNDNDRQVFWETLCSLEGKDVPIQTSKYEINRGIKVQ